MATLEINGVYDSKTPPRGWPAAPKKQRKPRPKPARSIRLKVKPSAQGRCGIVSIAVGQDTTDYILNVIPADWGQGFELDNLDNAELYHVNLDGQGHDSCDCKGHLRHGHCKHSEGIRALVKAGKL
jgi:hypothetical protein